MNETGKVNVFDTNNTSLQGRGSSPLVPMDLEDEVQLVLDEPFSPAEGAFVRGEELLVLSGEVCPLPVDADHQIQERLPVLD